ncbi:MAG: hypothetical protein HC915_17630 [Anaerolineae bacterium]|nr:hypothetical protein [Anaerolineae bacterium]
MQRFFRTLESYGYARQPGLRELCAPIRAARPSRELAAVSRVFALVSLQRNPIFWLALNLLVPWDGSVAALLALRKAALRARLPGWLETWFTLEAVNSLANFAYLNPDLPLSRGARPCRNSCWMPGRLAIP